MWAFKSIRQCTIRIPWVFAHVRREEAVFRMDWPWGCELRMNLWKSRRRRAVRVEGMERGEQRSPGLSIAEGALFILNLMIGD